jgi:hydrogenase-4 component F
MLTVAALLGPPVLASLVSIVIRPYRRTVGWLSVACAATSLAAAVLLGLTVARNGSVPAASAPTDVWRVDALSAVLAVCIAFVTFIASILGPGLRDGAAEGAESEARRFRIFASAFAFTMLVAVTVQNVALMWVAIEATTITSAVLIPLRATKPSVEASWKYLVICSVGIALAFAGTVLAYFDFVATAGDVPGALNWSALHDAAPSLHPELMQLAFAFMLVGYGTKAGLAPMHTWLPDAHSEAPAQISGMMSGVLLPVAMYAIARWKAVVDASVGGSFTDSLLIGFGVASIVVGAFSLVVQRHYKRMLAYSSVEHMGLVGIGLALGPLGAFAAWFHVVNHAVAKSLSFLAAGRVLERYQTSEIAKITGLLTAMPWTGPLFAAGILALVGVPPFGLFVSEFLILRAAVAADRLWLAGIVLLVLLTAFVSLLSHLNRMLYGDAPSGVAVGERASWPVAPLVASVGLLVVFGVIIPASLAMLLAQSARSLVP